MAPECKICKEPARGSFYGCVACESCKIFFKRNAGNKEKELKCRYDGNCDVNINNRHVCPSCRLKKCFENGMEIEKIRAPRSTVTKNKLVKSKSNVVALKTPDKLRPINLLDADQSNLNGDQWNLLSNLLKCFDEYSGLMIAQNFMNDQNKLPLKLRYKPASVIDLLQVLMGKNQLIYTNNRDFINLSNNDRSILLETTTVYTASSSVNFIHSQIGLMTMPVYSEVIGLVSHPTCVPVFKRIADRIISDAVIMKLFLAIVSFSTMRHTCYPGGISKNFSNIKDIIRIQNTYIDLAWRYLVYLYKFEWTVKWFSDLIRFLFAINDEVLKVEELVWFTNTIDSMTEKTKKTLTLSE